MAVITCQVTLFKPNGLVRREFPNLSAGLDAHYELLDAGAISVVTYYHDGEIRFPHVARSAR